MTRTEANRINAEAMEALKAVAKNHGMFVTQMSSQFGDDMIRTRFEFAGETYGEGNGMSKEASYLGLPDDIIGRTFSMRTPRGRWSIYTVTNLNLRRPKYPVTAISSRGTAYRFTVATVKRGLDN